MLAHASLVILFTLFGYAYAYVAYKCYLDSTSTASSTKKYTTIGTRRYTTEANKTLPSLSSYFSSAAVEDHDDKSKISLITGVAVSAVVLLILLLVIICYIRNKKARNNYNATSACNGYKKSTNEEQENSIERSEKHFFYVSYCESGSFRSKMVDFVSWFREQGYDVHMDIMQTPSKETQLRQLGRFRFGELQLRKAKNVFMILSARYLRLCKLDEEGETNLENLSHQERIVFSEIAQIRNELCSTIYRNSRFIPVLFGVKETDLPFWIKEMVVYSWPEDKLNKRLLFRLDEQVEYIVC